MNEIFEEVKNMSKSFLQTSGTFFKKISIPLLIVCIFGLLLVACYYVITIEDGSYRKGKKSNTPYAVEQHTNNVDIDTDGNATTSKTAQELWDQMLEDGSRVDEYLDNPEELQKLITAQMVTDYLDTRANPNAKIDWEDLNKEAIETGKVQGIIKLKRANSDGSNSTLTYVDPETFQMYINNYNTSGSDEDKKKALSHFTLEKGFVSSNGGGNYKRGTDGEAKLIEGEEIQEVIDNIPENVGIRYTFNSWQRANAVPSKQMDLKEKAGVTFDEDDYGRINGRYAVAVTEKFGEIGDYIDYYYIDTNGVEQVIHCIVCDRKGSDANNEWGHHGGEDILEFYVNEITWTTPEWEFGDLGQASSAHPNPAEGGFYMHWKGKATKVVRGGNYFDNPDFVNNKNTSGNSSSESNKEKEDENESEETKQEGGFSESTENEPLKWPTNTPTTVTSYFGNRNTGIAGASTNHQGIDIANYEALHGTPIYATESGKVVNAEYGHQYNGNWIKLDHGNGYESLYLHCNTLEDLSVGDTVAKGQQIATIGNTGVGSGSHLHFAIKLNGAYIDPLTFKYDYDAYGNGTGGFGSAVDAGSANVGTASYYAKVATWNETTEIIESDDPNVESISDTRHSMSSTRINYQQLVSGYRMPFDYLWALLVVSQDKNFVFELAELVYDSEIEITIHDNVTTNTNVTVDIYKRKTKVTTENINVNVAYDENTATRTSSQVYEGEIEDPYTTTTTVITKTNTLTTALTKADVWIVKYTQDSTYETVDEPSTTSKIEHKNEEYPETPDKTDSIDTLGFASIFKQQIINEYTQNFENVTATVTSLLSKYYYKTVDRVENITNTVHKTKYTLLPAKTPEEKTEKKLGEENFVTIFVRKRKAKNNIRSGAGILFEILGNSEDTVDMVELTKYLLYKATNTKYDGVETFDFSIYDPKNFKKLGGGGTSNIDGVEGQIYDFLLAKGVPPVGAAAVLGNINGESSFDPTAINPENNAAFGLCQWMDKRFENLKKLASDRKVEWTDVDVQLEYMWRELEGDYPRVYEVIMNATEEDDLEYAVWYWGGYFEIYFTPTTFEESKHETAARYRLAKNSYEKFKSNQTNTNDEKKDEK